MLINDQNQEYFTLKKYKLFKIKVQKTPFISNYLDQKNKGKIIPYKPSQNIKDFKKYGGKSINIICQRTNSKIFQNAKLFKKSQSQQIFP